MPRVSVIVPTFNRSDCLVDTLRAALTQSFQDLELIVIDDGSTDDSAVEVLRQLGPDPERAEGTWRQHLAGATGPVGFGFWRGEIPLQYIYQPNRGMGAARNRGLQAASADYIAFLEPDYAWEVHYLQRQMEFFEHHPDAWIAHGRPGSTRSSTKNGRRRGRETITMPFEQVVGGAEICASAIVVRRRCIELHGGFDENLPACEDYDLWVRIASHVPIYFVSDSVVSARRPPNPPSWGLDRYRVYALEKAYQSGHLNSDQRHRVAEELVARCDLLVEGFRKRNNTERANFYDRKRKKHELEVTKLVSGSAASRSAPLAGWVPTSVEGNLSPSGRF
jgi:glycosyltransferase involved in cell wall biosynthesis